MMSERMYEIGVVDDDDGEIINRGGIKATRKTVLRWISVNDQNCPCPDGYHYAAVDASDEAITYREWLAECREIDEVLAGLS